MAFSTGTNDPWATQLDPAMLQKLANLQQSAQTLSATQNYKNAFYSEMVTTAASALGKAAKYGTSVNISSPKKSRDVSTGTVLRGINGLLYKIAEMKGR